MGYVYQAAVNVPESCKVELVGMKDLFQGFSCFDANPPIFLCRLAQRILHGDVPESLLHRKVEPELPLTLYPVLGTTGFLSFLIRVSAQSGFTLIVFLSRILNLGL